MRKHSGYFRSACLPALLLAMAAVCSPAAAQDCETKIGALGPMSGGAAAWGLAMKAGAEFAAAQANEAGGVQIGNRKCKVTVLNYDSKYTADGAAAGANYMASQNVKVIIGPVGSPEATGIKPVAQRNQQLTFNSSYAKDAIGPQLPLPSTSWPDRAPGHRRWSRRQRTASRFHRSSLSRRTTRAARTSRVSTPRPTRPTASRPRRSTTSAEQPTSRRS